MKKALLLLVLFFSLILLSSPILAQDKAEETKIIVEEEGKIEVQEFHTIRPVPQNINGFKGNGGPAVGMMQVDLSTLNNILEDLGFTPMNEDIITFGGGGLGGFKDGFRFGGIGMIGRTDSKNDDGERLILEISYGGFLFEQGIFASPMTDLSIGGLVGGGVMLLNRIEKNPPNFNEAIEKSHSTSLSKEFVMIQPTISLHQQLMAFIGLNITIGYIAAYDMGMDWDFFGTKIDGPLDFFHGPTATIRLSFGF